MDPAAEEQLLKQLIAAAPGIENGNMAMIAATVWFLWDWAISLNLEVEHFWGKKFTTGTFLYFCNRFLGLFITLIHFQTSVRPLSPSETEDICKPITFLLLIFNGLSGFVVQTVLVLRTYALWDCNKIVFWALMTLSVSALLAQEALVGAYESTFSVVPNPLPAPYTGCLDVFTGWEWQRYVPILAFEIMIAALMLFKLIQYVRQGRGNRVFYVLFRDGFVEFIAVTICSIFSLFIGIFEVGGADNFDLITYDLAQAISLIACARMLLNIRDVMKLSDPRDPTKPNPWSLDDTFDLVYGLGGQHEITLEGVSIDDDGDSGPSEKPARDGSGGSSSNADLSGGEKPRGDSNSDELEESGEEESPAARRRRKKWEKMRMGADEEAAMNHRELMLGLGGGDGTGSVFSATQSQSQAGSMPGPTASFANPEWGTGSGTGMASILEQGLAAPIGGHEHPASTSTSSALPPSSPEPAAGPSRGPPVAGPSS